MKWESNLKWAHIKATIRIQDLTNAVKSFEISNAIEIGPQSYEVTMPAEVIGFNKALLEHDGFVVIRFLSELERRQGIIFGSYGPFLDIDENRYYLVMPIEKATRAGLVIYNWTLEGWLE